MKPMLKKIFIGLGALVLLVIIFFVSYGIKAKSEVKKMTPSETMEITDNVFSVRDSFTNVYLVRDSNNYIMIDAGNNTEAVAEGLKKLAINPDNVVAILLTHSDGDHVASLSLFKNATLYLSEQEEQMINGETSRFLFFGNHIDRADYTVIDDQQTLQIGNISIKGILTPGHTPGSMCYVVSNKYLFTGDLLRLENGKIDRFNEFFNMDTETSVRSMGLITRLDRVKYIFTAHYGFSDDYSNAVKDWDK
jgi:hydroxyacylglutathione hydrolase